MTTDLEHRKGPGDKNCGQPVKDDKSEKKDSLPDAYLFQSY